MILVTGIAGNSGIAVLKELCKSVSSKKIVGIVKSQQNQFGFQIEYGDYQI